MVPSNFFWITSIKYEISKTNNPLSSNSETIESVTSFISSMWAKTLFAVIKFGGPNLFLISFELLLFIYSGIVKIPLFVASFAISFAGSIPIVLLKPFSLKIFNSVPSLLPISRTKSFLVFFAKINKRST